MPQVSSTARSVLRRIALKCVGGFSDRHHGSQRNAPSPLPYAMVGTLCSVANSVWRRLCAWFDLLQNEDDHVICLLCVGNFRISAWKAWDISQCYVAKYPGEPPRGQSALLLFGMPPQTKAWRGGLLWLAAGDLDSTDHGSPHRIKVVCWITERPRDRQHDTVPPSP